MEGFAGLSLAGCGIQPDGPGSRHPFAPATPYPSSCKAKCQPYAGLTSPSATIDLGILANSGSRQIPVDVDCNTPFSYVVRSLAGGLKVPDSGAPPPGFASLIPYLVQLSIPTDAGVASGECESSELIGDNPACTYGSSPTGIAIAQTGTLTLTWATPNELVAGTYSDVLTLTIQPRW